MSFISAWLADYPFAPAIVFFVPAVLLFVFDVWDCNWGLKHDDHTHFSMRILALICFMLAGMLTTIEFDNWVFISPERTMYYIENHRGDRKEIAFCFKRFDQQDVLPFTGFMEKCVVDDWQREQYRRMKKDETHASTDNLSMIGQMHAFSLGSLKEKQYEVK